MGSQEFDILKSDVVLLTGQVSELASQVPGLIAQVAELAGQVADLMETVLDEQKSKQEEDELGVENYITEIIGPNVMRDGSVVSIIDEPLPPADILYEVLAVREYNESTGVIVAVGDETGGSGRVLKWVADWVRIHHPEGA